MKLIIGLGNPGEQYQKTRHNAGFMVLDALQKNLNAPDFKLNKKLFAEISETALSAGEKLILAKPQTFMNDSGQAVQALIRYYKAELNDVIIVYDDSDLPLGKLRIGKFKSAGGHHGLESILSHLKKTEFIRFKVGIRPLGNPKKAVTFILKTFSSKEKKLIDEIINKAVEAVKMTFTEPIQKVMSKYN